MTEPTAFVALLRCEELEEALGEDGLEVQSFEGLEPLMESARTRQPRICAVGAGFSADSVERTVRHLRKELPLTDVLVWSPRAPADAVRAALLQGARDFVLDPDPAVAAGRVRAILGEQTLLPLVLEHEDREEGAWRFEGLVSRNREMWSLFETCIRMAPTAATVLVNGETGTGKDLIARAIHRRSGRKGRFVALNCGAVPETLIDAQLFGHVEGAYTGAVGSKDGLFRHADGGTLFLDEIGNIPLGAQNRLLRTLQSETVRPVGGDDEVPVDVRVIAATSASLETSIEEGSFREDLFYRLNVIRLIVPPLRERPEDVVFLFGHFAQRLADQYSLARPRITGGFLDAVQAYDWPGNVRELENFVERLLLTHPGEHLTREHFRRLTRAFHVRGDETDDRETDEPLPESSAMRRRTGLHGAVVDTGRPLADVVDDATEDVERAYLEGVLHQTGGRVARAAEHAGISRRTLLRKMRRYGIDKKSFRK
ncbi:sigma-54 dependent transcriptional regulator [bacterium]|nr:sigma-54 dependent transcriptional regulator [bacterium]